VLVAGWQWSRRQRPRPVFTRIVKPIGNGGFTINRLPRHWSLRAPRGFTTKVHEADETAQRAQRRILLSNEPDGYVSNQALKALSERLSRASADECETHLVECIRQAAKGYTEVVGPHCMSVLMPNPSLGWVRIRFIPNVQHEAKITTKAGSSGAFPVAYSPWIIGLNAFAAPSINVGDSSVPMGHVRVIMEAPQSGRGPRGLMSSVKRPGHPLALKQN
jgi:hypothetical protein